MQETEHTWERQPGESTRAYEAFCIFRDLPHQSPPKKRSKRLTAALMSTGGKPTQYKTWVMTCGKKYNWDERARDYDNELQRIQLEERKEQIRQALENKIKIGKGLQAKALKALAELPTEVLSARNVLDYLERGAAMEHDALIELTGGLGAASGGKPNGGIMGELNEQVESTMMQLVRSLEAARRKKEQ